MNGYFKPLRRKVGVVTLLVACAFMVVWARGFYVRETISFVIPPIKYGVDSHSGCFELHFEERLNRIDEHTIENALTHIEWPHLVQHDLTIFLSISVPIERSTLNRRQFFGCTSGRKEFDFGSAIFLESWVAIPCGFVVIPLTLLSAWLLLSKPGAGRLSIASPPKTEP